MSEWKFDLQPRTVKKVKTRFRTISTRIPVPESLWVFKDLSEYESHSMHGQLPVVWDKAEDFQVFDAYGNRWIDFTSTIFVANAGHANEVIIAALRRGLDKKLLHTYTFASESRAKFLKKLIAITPKQYEKAFLVSAGTEATECALKLVRLHGLSISSKKKVVISFQGCMHGRTMGAELLKGDPKASSWIAHQDPNIRHLQIAYPWVVNCKKMKSADWEDHFAQNMRELKKQGLKYEDIAGFIIESYVGWSAYLHPKAYIQALAKFAKKHRALLCFDEIQGGFGRTGKLFVYEHYGVEPDLICLGKALSGSLPLAAVIGRKKIMDLPGFGSMSSTHSANPLCCIAGLANLTAIEKGKLAERSAQKGAIMHRRLEAMKKRFPYRISYLFGQGLLAAILFKDPRTGLPDGKFPSKVCEKAMEKGLLLVHTGRESIKIGPPLTIPEAALNEGLDVLEECLDEVEAGS